MPSRRRLASSEVVTSSGLSASFTLAAGAARRSRAPSRPAQRPARQRHRHPAQAPTHPAGERQPRLGADLHLAAVRAKIAAGDRLGMPVAVDRGEVEPGDPAGVGGGERRAAPPPAPSASRARRSRSRGTRSRSRFRPAVTRRMPSPPPAADTAAARPDARRQAALACKCVSWRADSGHKGSPGRAHVAVLAARSSVCHPRSPAISVVIAHLNQPEPLAALLASLYAQDFDMGSARSSWSTTARAPCPATWSRPFPA